MADFSGEDLAGARFTRTDLTGAEFWAVDLSRARFRGVDFRGVVVRGAEFADVRIDGEIQNLVVNGVDVTSFVEAELDRRDPDRAKMRPTDADGFRAGGGSWSSGGNRRWSGHAASIPRCCTSRWTGSGRS